MFGPLALALLLTLPGASNAAGDARLNDVCFIDAQRGWAVGDRGVIWHTDDGGRAWQQQTSGVDCNLAAVWFHNPLRGWVAGGFTRPYTHVSVGVLLSTYDGGKTWEPVDKLLLPPFRKIGFWDARHGWAVGCRSVMHPSGVFMTDDGGDNWRPLAGGDGLWNAGQFFDRRAGVLAGRNASLTSVRDGVVPTTITSNEDLDLRGFTQLRVTPEGVGWAVGEGGLVCYTENFGSRWRPPAGEMPKSARFFDFAALAARGRKCWIAGSPGTRVFHSPDAGQTWTVFDTGVTMPLRAMAFADDGHGWAVGELGTIIATDDGGRTWRRQHAGGARAMYLAFAADAEDAPLELLARFSGNDGCFSAVAVLARRDLEIGPRDDVPSIDRLHEAVTRLGGCATVAAWQFPTRQPGLSIGHTQIVEFWNRAGGGQGVESLQAEMVRQIRLWRPDNVIVSHAQGGDDSLASVVEQAVRTAVGQAIDAKAFADRTLDIGLKPWQVKRVFTALPPGARGTLEIVPAQFMPGLGRSIAEAVVEPRGLLADRFSVAPTTLAFQASMVGFGRDDVSGGSAGSADNQSQRELPRPPTEQLGPLQRMSQCRQQALAIIGHVHRSGKNPEELLAQTNELIGGLDDENAGQVLFQLADQNFRGGQWAAAAEMFQLLVDRFPKHSLAGPSLRWLLQYHASAAAAWRVQHDATNQNKCFERAVEIGKDIERTQFDQSFEPSVRFPLAAAYRNLEQTHQADRLYQAQGRTNGRDAWRERAQDELRLLVPQAASPRQTLVCVKAETKPLLDGKLDDAVWKKAKPAALQSAQHDDAEWPATIMFAYDAEYLYFAVRCRQPADAAANVAGTSFGRRTRDADLTAHDRVEVFLDIDRNYFTYYTLAVDHRGWTHDSFWGDDTWNPQWFVAARREAGWWTIEAAIPFSELTGRVPKPHDVWAVGVQRIAPGVGFQSWNTPAAVKPLPDGFGHLVFE